MPDLAIGRIPAIHGAPGAARELAARLGPLTDARRVAVLMDPALAGSGRGAGIVAALAADGFMPDLLVMPPGEPKEAAVAAAARQTRDFRAGAVVCVGGGSVMDAGKLVASLTAAPDDLARYRLAAAPLPRERLPLLCVPTTAGTGAEATAVSVLAGEDGSKYWFWADSLKPDVIVHDPELALDLPPAITAATGVDALVHAIEAATNANAAPANTLFALHAITLVTRWLPHALRAPQDLEARARLLEAATFAGVAIDNAGTAIAHNIGHALGSLAPIPHGRAVAIGMAATLDWNVEGDPEAYAGVADAMGLAGPQQLAAGFLRFVLGCGLDLSTGAIAPAALARQMARPENAAMLRANRRPANEADLLRHASAAAALAERP
ncbi:iron-containing alcohol dehydrogenase [Phenylobacterium sp.]|uniref:iron-containing alcohol dehydrogenase n=1 Tax=Phenylobacterium sp. TaxID=1871053 RepID=UPI0025D2D005|nr:iron-containing alcohol dehydrogenase [Phenylobacterium sp.]